MEERIGWTAAAETGGGVGAGKYYLSLMRKKRNNKGSKNMFTRTDLGALFDISAFEGDLVLRRLLLE